MHHIFLKIKGYERWADENPTKECENLPFCMQRQKSKARWRRHFF